MKKIINILLIFSIGVLFNCCKDNSTGPSEEFILSGTIENWTYGGSIKLKAGVWDSTHHCLVALDSNLISSSGNFSLKLKNVPDSLLYTIAIVSDSMQISNVTISPPNTKSNKTWNLIYGINLLLFNDTIQIGSIHRFASISISRWFEGEFFYFNQNVQITGTLILRTPPHYQDTVFYNYSGKKGWNKVVCVWDSLSYNTYNRYITSNEPPGGKWVANIY